MNKRQKLCNKYYSKIKQINEMNEMNEMNKLNIAIKIENYYLKDNSTKNREFIWNLIMERTYVNIEDKLNIYYEPHIDTVLEDIWIRKKEIVNISVAYFDNNQKWYKLSDGRGWLLVN
tara:strand:+ start:263 stop:616 length:354 start_codon:yes stop_codon:yes gene_type:complete